MSKILLIGKNENLMQKCAERLRWRGYKVLVHNDVMDGLREVMILSVGCIIWQVDTKEPARSRKYKAIQRYHRFMPVIIVDNEREAYGPDIDQDTHFLPDNTAADELVNKVSELIQPHESYNDDDESEEFETEYGMYE